MAFGVFDLLHDGHRHFLSAAKKLGRRLVVVVAPDASVLAIKKFPPQESLAQRMKNLAAKKLADEIVAGDEILGSWNILERVLPDVIALGYDQKALGETLQDFIAREKLPIKLAFIGPHTDSMLHSSTLRKKI